METQRFALQLIFVLTAFFGSATASLGSDETLVGEWLIESSKLAEKPEEANPPSAAIRVTKDRVLLMRAGKTELELDYRLNRAKTPQEIDLTFELDKGNGPFKVGIKGILKVKDGRVLLCLNGDPNGDRPTKFKSATKKNGYMVFKLKRASSDNKQTIDGALSPPEGQ